MNRFYARDTVIEVDLDAIAHNVKEFKRHIGPEIQVMAVVKANAYGHGAVYVAREALAAGATYLGVSFVDEAIELREAGITAPILVLSFTPPEAYSLAIQHRLALTIYEKELLAPLQAAALAADQKVKVHIKVDTGMGRIGLQPEEVPDFLHQVQSESQIEVEGLYMHYSSADEADKSYTQRQLRSFQAVLKEVGDSFPLIHSANSAAAIELPDQLHQMIRLGISLYGYYPSVEVNHQAVSLRPALTLKSKVIQCKQPPEGTGISYGKTFITSGKEIIATVPVGYADGYNRLLSNSGVALIRGQRVPIVGRVCMDHLMLDVTSIGPIEIGEEVVLYGRQGQETIHIDEIARQLETIDHEITCALNHRVPRQYFRNGQLIAILNRLRKERIKIYSNN
ncbi:alanine racemase [Seinonella peptonophila]|uniref:Alanine racemase n=1 Tax=Seinonella peptonophila TaxID=112248 RepID=A0A1M4YCX3_9BACL|nr:alanine racemase [Seinonella peptonophila]SHF03433.1 alanine racemase [Seinonella peptonophila]